MKGETESPAVLGGTLKVGETCLFQPEGEVIVIQMPVNTHKASAFLGPDSRPSALGLCPRVATVLLGSRVWRL